MTGIRTTLAVVTGMLRVANSSAEDVKKEKERLVGNWNVMSVAANGQKFPPDAIKDFQFIFSADKLTRKKDGKVESESGYRIDPSKKPKWMDFLGPKEEKQKVVPILYELEGDTLKVCFRVDYKKDEQV